MTIIDATQEALSYIKKNSPAVFALHGDLGAGKTYFTNIIAKELGIPHKLKSPTFTLLQEYPIQFADKRSLIHCDFYRIEESETEKVLKQISFFEYVVPSAIIMIEWPEKLGNTLQGIEMIHLRILESNNVRNYTFYV